MTTPTPSRAPSLAPTWSAEVPDPYVAYYRPLQRLRRYRLLAAALTLGMLLQAGVMAVWLLKPTPVVVLPTQAGVAPWVLSSDAPPPSTAAQAEGFVAHAVRLRYGWRSDTVLSSLQAYLALCRPAYRQTMEAWLQEPDASQPRWRAWQQSRTWHLVAPAEEGLSVTCAPGDQPGLWLCQGELPRFTRVHTSEDAETVSFQTLKVLALLLRARPSPSNPWGFELLDLSEQTSSPVPPRSP